MLFTRALVVARPAILFARGANQRSPLTIRILLNAMIFLPRGGLSVTPEVSLHV